MTKVEAVEGWRIELPLVRPHVTADSTVTSRDLALIRVQANGIDGWGECSPVPGYSVEVIADAWDALQATSPLLIGHDAEPDLVADRPLPPSASAALEAAIWDLAARNAGKPLWQFLGGTTPEVAAGAVIGVDAEVSETAEALAAGYGHVKVKVAPGPPEGRLREIVSRFPELPIGADANGSYGADGDPETLDDLGLLYLEQPLPSDRIGDHAALAAAMKTPICLDEDMASIADFHRAIDAGAADAVTLRAQRLGGAGVMGAHAVALVDGIPLRYGGMLESGVGRAHAIALATLPGFTLPSDLGASSRYFGQDVVSPGWALTAGRLIAPDMPGIGVEVDREFVAVLATDHFSFS